ncbi:phosphonate ABC transporter, permease protein PhnE [Roseinatronobacter sp. S2]|uniref:phosphonate ABC transporter, permease protein PhnE n=1 Tax=Roseinatronobacter sp. S2 TaxID=3035471 RepID=UPI00240FF7B5|nr:phosphonate ABC transporter, permease protein PhnE [Roseinatronobacter sp. S2]MCC5960448.1 phosphonate ABC transporter, permease protein PhnE [Paracoccaceae bacterium]WFE75993.1 phosphonate ABC transporter, permease protein PhnE [Roseinatronobacter sp. S2]
MSTLTFHAISDADIAAARKRHPKAFGDPFVTTLKAASWAFIVVYLIWSLGFFEIGKLLNASDRAWALMTRMVIWQDMAGWQYANIYKGIAQTIAMAFLGTFLGTILALGLAFFAARNTMPVGVIRHGVRRLLDVFRGIDQIVWGLVFVRAVGLGPLAGVLAIFISDTGNLAKLYSEAIENIDRKQVEGVRATGADTGRIIRYGYLPQILPVFISLSLYSFESSTRSATILGLVGAGGIGMIIIERFRAGLFDQVAFVVLNVLVVIAIIDWGSGLIRKRFIGERGH